jgi:hypothetical protein
MGWTAGFAAQLSDARVGGTHTLLEMVRQQLVGDPPAFWSHFVRVSQEVLAFAPTAFDTS